MDIFWNHTIASTLLTVSPRGVLRLVNDGDDRRIFLGLKFSIPGFFWVGKFGKYFFGY